MSNVLVTIPHTGFVHAETAEFINKLILDNKGHVLTIKYVQKEPPLENALHHIIKDIRKEQKWDYWLLIDSDVVPQKNPLDLIENDKDVIGMPYPQPHFTGEGRPYYLIAMEYVDSEDAYREKAGLKGLTQVDAVGGGSLLINTKIFNSPLLQQGAFMRTYNTDGTVDKGNDFAFCERVRKAGFEIWTHSDYLCRHHKTIDALSMAQEFKRWLTQ